MARCFAETSLKRRNRPTCWRAGRLHPAPGLAAPCTIFAKEIGINLTPTQWAALAKLTETGPCSQNQLGRLAAMDVATIKGVIDRLTARPDQTS
jgi:hypothetical protein